MALRAGTRLHVYEITGPLGAGGMGEVFRARDTRLNRDVAIKMLPDSVALDQGRLARFEREARTLAALNHPHIAQIYGLEDAPSSGQGATRVSSWSSSKAPRSPIASPAGRCRSRRRWRSRVRSPTRSSPRTPKASSIAI